MKEIVTEVEIRASPGRIWQVLVDFAGAWSQLYVKATSSFPATLHTSTALRVDKA